MADDEGRRSTTYGRRASDSTISWLPFALSVATTLMMLGVIYGKLGGRLDLIEYRLQQIEQKVKLVP